MPCLVAWAVSLVSLRSTPSVALYRVVLGLGSLRAPRSRSPIGRAGKQGIRAIGPRHAPPRAIPRRSPPRPHRARRARTDHATVRDRRSVAVVCVVCVAAVRRFAVCWRMTITVSRIIRYKTSSPQRTYHSPSFQHLNAPAYLSALQSAGSYRESTTTTYERSRGRPSSPCFSPARASQLCIFTSSSSSSSTAL